MRAAESQVMARIAALLDAPDAWVGSGSTGVPELPGATEPPDGPEVLDLPGVPGGTRTISAGWVPSPPEPEREPGPWPEPEPEPEPEPWPDDPADDPTDDARDESRDAPHDDAPHGKAPHGEAPDDGDDPPQDEAGDEAHHEALGALQARALTSAMAAYTAAHGHPEQAGAFDAPGRRRWGMRARAGVVAAAVLLALGGAIVLRSVQQTPSVVVAGAAPATTTTGAIVQPEVVVHVVGAVAQPGLVRLPEGSRVADAVDAAGGAGADADLTAVNLARVLVDGEQVVVSRPGEQAAPTGPTGSTLLDLNSADAAALDGLPGIGPVLAGRIVDWRTEHGTFTVVDELAEVTGIGPSLLAGVRDLVRVG